MALLVPGLCRLGDTYLNCIVPDVAVVQDDVQAAPNWGA